MIRLTPNLISNDIDNITEKYRVVFISEEIHQTELNDGNINIIANNENNNLIIYGTNGSSVRTYMCFNGDNKIVYSATEVDKQFNAGKYYVFIEVAGPANNYNDWAITITTSTFNNAIAYTNGNIIDIDQNFAIGLLIKRNVNFGDENNKSIFNISLYKLTSIDIESRLKINFLNNNLSFYKDNTEIKNKYGDKLIDIEEPCNIIAGSSFVDTPNGNAGVFINNLIAKANSKYFYQYFYDIEMNKSYCRYNDDKWIPFSNIYDLYPTGDDTDRSYEIAHFVLHNKKCKLAPGNYYIDTMVLHGDLEGAGMDKTYLIYKESDNTYRDYFVRLNAHHTISNLTLEYQANQNITPVENYSTGVSGLTIIGTGNDSTQEFGCTVENVRIRNFTGCGLFVRNTGYHPASGCSFINVRVEYCSAGIYCGEYAEFHKFVNCWANFCYTGCIIMGGNNTYSNCVFSYNEVNLSMPDSDYYGNSNNDAHGIIECCNIHHSGVYSTYNNGTAIFIGAQSSTELIANCCISYGKIIIQDRGNGLLFNGCDIKNGVTFLIDNCRVNIFNSLFHPNTIPPQLSNNAYLKLKNCMTPDGQELSDYAE